MEIKTLKSFVAVATFKNFSTAARELNIVQPAISRQITNLEKELGVCLLWRNTREVRVTPAGESLLRDAKKIIASETAAKEQAQKAAEGKTGRLLIGYLGPACFTFIPDLVRMYATCYPEVEIKLREMTVQQQLDMFEVGQLDIGFSRSLPTAYHKEFSVEDIYMDTLIAVIPKRHPLAKSKSLRLHELQKERFILFSRLEAAGLFDQIISVCQEEKFAPAISSQPENMQMLLTEVAAGLGVSVVPACVKRMYTKGCVFVPIYKQKPSIATQLHYRPDPPQPTVEAFVKITLENKEMIREQMETE